MERNKPDSDALTEKLIVADSGASETETKPLVIEPQPTINEPQFRHFQSVAESLQKENESLKDENAKLKVEIVEAKYKTGELTLEPDLPEKSPQSEEDYLSGDVTDSDTHIGIRAAKITIRSSIPIIDKSETHSNEQGRFLILLPVGEYRLSVSADEYKTESVPVRVVKGQDNWYDVQLIKTPIIPALEQPPKRKTLAERARETYEEQQRKKKS